MPLILDSIVEAIGRSIRAATEVFDEGNELKDKKIKSNKTKHEEKAFFFG